MNDMRSLHYTCSVKIIAGYNVTDFNISGTFYSGLLLRCAGKLPHELGEVDKLKQGFLGVQTCCVVVFCYLV